MSDLLYYSTFGLTVVLAIISFAIARMTISGGRTVKSAVSRYTLATIASGLFSGIVYLYGTLSLLDHIGMHVNFGHGVEVVVAPVFNLVLSAVIALIGRIVLLWEPLH